MSALMAEVLIGLFVVIGRLGALGAFALHLIVVAVLVAWMSVCRRRGDDVGMPAVLAISVAVAGPFGALGGLLLPRLSRTDATDTARLAQWYDRISMSIETDAMSRLSDHVAIGRSLDLGAPAPAPFAALLEGGSVAEKQAILGLIARRFHPDYLPALKIALISPEPVIRVQAAAVAARVRGDLAALTGRLIVEANDPARPAGKVLQAVEQLRHCVASGLMEDKDIARVTGPMMLLEHRTLAHLDTATQARHGMSGRMALGVLANDTDARVAYEARLLSEKRYGEFRALRRAVAWRSEGRFRYRSVSRNLALKPLSRLAMKRQRATGERA